MHSEKSNPQTIVFRGDNGELLSLKPMYRIYPDELDYWDGNWIQTEVKIKVSGFRGKLLANLRAEEFAEFRQQLEALESDLSGLARYYTVEEWLEINVKGDGLGHFTVESFARDAAGTGNRLEFHFSFDQTYLAAILAGLKAATSAFPVRGEANA